jgi:hypothetical protein
MKRCKAAGSGARLAWSEDSTARDQNGQALAYVYFEDEPGRRSAAHLLTRVVGMERGQYATQAGQGRVAATARWVLAARDHDQNPTPLIKRAQRIQRRRRKSWLI